MSAHLLPFREEYSTICDLILSLEADEDAETDCSCGMGRRTVRCDECIPSQMSCPDCFVKAHRNNPLHYASVWRSSRFHRESYSSLGGSLHLGHRGNECPARLSSRNETSAAKLTIVHTNGIHTVQVYYCQCADADRHWAQLLRHRMFPATTKVPETAFSFAVLKLCHMFTLCAQSSTYSMAQVLRRITNDAYTHQVPVTYYHVYLVVRRTYKLQYLERLR